ncbi:MAG: response regulator [candidate division WOR-3 bacterium]
MYRKKILLIDDDSHILDILEARLEKSGYSCLRAMEGIKALKLVEEEHPDLIILDILLPGELDGYTLCKQLKTDIRFNKIPVILLSGLDEEYHIQEGLKRGADAYITKPFQHEDLIAKIEELIRKREEKLPADD